MSPLESGQTHPFLYCCSVFFIADRHRTVGQELSVSFTVSRKAQDRSFCGPVIHSQPSPVDAVPGTSSRLTGLANTATATLCGWLVPEQHAAQVIGRLIETNASTRTGFSLCMVQSWPTSQDDTCRTQGRFCALPAAVNNHAKQGRVSLSRGVEA